MNVLIADTRDSCGSEDPMASSVPKLNGSLSSHSRHAQPSSNEQNLPRKESDVVIVGAGVVGCALAVALGNQGRRVFLLEKSWKEPDRIVGELLQPGGVLALEQLGMLDCLEDIDAVQVLGYNVIYHGTQVPIQYPNDKNSTPFQGRSFHHGKFIMRLRRAALSNPNVRVVETKVVSTIESTHGREIIGVNCVTRGGEDSYYAPLTFVADGYASSLRKRYLPYTPRVKSRFWGLELHNVQLPLPSHGHVILSDGPPVLAYQIGKDETRVLVDVPEKLVSASAENGGIRGHLLNTVLPTLPKSIQPGFALALEKNQLRSMPNSFLPSTTNRTPGLVFLGDALNMRHPLTGGGMTVGLRDVVHIRDLLCPENVTNLTDTKLVLQQMSEFHWKRKSSSTVVNILAQALYALFAADDQYLKVLQRGCFRYFELGFVEEPAGMLAGVVCHPLILFSHFFKVAFLSMWMHLTSPPLYMLPVAFIQCALVFMTACMVIFPFIFAELRS